MCLYCGAVHFRPNDQYEMTNMMRCYAA